MKKFMNEDFLLNNKTACKLFAAANEMEIFDYHCHLIPSEIESNKRFTSITEAWLAGDHYKWRQMRTNGIDESLITGDADPYDKFYAWVQTIEKLIGNPLYHWTHLELQRYFDFYEPLTTNNAREVYDLTNSKLANDNSLDVFGIMKKFKVNTVGTTDDPCDSLDFHKKIKEKGLLSTNVLPSFRPDKAVNIENNEFIEYILKLENITNIKINNVNDVVNALVQRLDYFVQNGCKATDHGLTVPPSIFLSESETSVIFNKRMSGESLSDIEIDAYKGYILSNLGRAYHKRNLVMQLHMAVLRNANTYMFTKLGADTGFDYCHDINVAKATASFLDELAKTQELPKTILYSLNPKDYYSLGTLMGSFQQSIPGKIQLGSGWWFCDHRDGMEEQMKVLGNLGMLPHFVGMLTDSRSFLSYPRHEYFRRIMCNIIGTWAEYGEIPSDIDYLTNIVNNISFSNAKNYFN